MLPGKLVRADLPLLMKVVILDGHSGLSAGKRRTKPNRADYQCAHAISLRNGFHRHHYERSPTLLAASLIASAGS
jgi:hypothetical protein